VVGAAMLTGWFGWPAYAVQIIQSVTGSFGGCFAASVAAQPTDD
jgi:hypothetical protein